MNFLESLQFVLKTENYRLDWCLAFAIVITTIVFYVLLDFTSFEKKILNILQNGPD